MLIRKLKAVEVRCYISKRNCYLTRSYKLIVWVATCLGYYRAFEEVKFEGLNVRWVILVVPRFGPLIVNRAVWDPVREALLVEMRLHQV